MDTIERRVENKLREARKYYDSCRSINNFEGICDALLIIEVLEEILKGE